MKNLTNLLQVLSKSWEVEWNSRHLSSGVNFEGSFDIIDFDRYVLGSLGTLDHANVDSSKPRCRNVP